MSATATQPAGRFARYGISQIQRNPVRALEIDLGLAVMCALSQPGRCYDSGQIAAVTGLSQAGVTYITRSALKKLRRIPEVRRLLREAR